MDKKDLLELIKDGENGTTEFKMTSRILFSTFGRMISAFLNSKGGNIIVGIKEPNEIIGIDEESASRIESYAIPRVTRDIRPHAACKVDKIKIDNKFVVIINVPEGVHKPYGYSGVYYIRSGISIEEMGHENLLTFFKSNEIFDKNSISNILEKVTSIEYVLSNKIGNKLGNSIFISHGGHPEIREKVEDFIESLELNPIVVKNEASEGMSVDDKVEKYIKKSQAAIILYTQDDELKTGKFLPRQNVIHETGVLQLEMPGKIVYLKDSKVELPTNIAPKVYSSFSNNDLTDSFIQIVKEFKSFGIL